MKVMARPTFDALLDELDGRHAALTAASAALLETIAKLDQAESWCEEDETSLSCFLAARLGARSATAREWVRVARKLRELPRIRAAHAEGVLSWDQLRPVTRFATPEADEQLSIRALAMTVPQLYREAARHEKQRRKRAESDHQLRSAHMR